MRHDAFLKKKDGDEAHKAQAGSERKPAASELFLSYFRHYDPHTLITENGELMQCIKITANARGLDYESGDGNGNTVRDTVRRAIASAVTHDRCALWMHTVRKRRPIESSARFTQPFAAYVGDAWEKKHHWKFQYYNEIYITVLHDGQSASLLNKSMLPKGMLPASSRLQRNAYLESAHRDLSRTVETMLAVIRPHYDARRLSLVERQDESHPERMPLFYSEPAEFLSFLLNLRDEPFPVTDQRLCDALPRGGLYFGFNALETRAADGAKRFASMISLKQYTEAVPDAIDRVLQSPIELIVSESLSFVPATKALNHCKMQKWYFDISGDSYSAKASGLIDMLADNRKNPTDYAEHQVSVMVLTDEYRHLDAETLGAQEAFGELGLITIREDIKLEECFWARMPGNFEFIRRNDIIAGSKAAGFVRLNRFPNGRQSGNHWGDALALIPTQVGSPYFFNFHHHDNGHTLLFDFNSFGDRAANILLHFLLASAGKYEGRTWVFDRGGQTRLLCDKLGGHYYRPGFTPAGLRLNPFRLENTPRNQAFLAAWCAELAGQHSGSDTRPAIRAAVAALYEQPEHRRSFGALVAMLGGTHPEIAGALAPFAPGGAHAGLIDGEEDGLEANPAFQAFDMDALAERPEARLALFSYLMHRIVTTADGKPGIVVLHDACALLDNPFFLPRLESLMEILTQHNVMLIAISGAPQEDAASNAMPALLKGAATRIYVPDDILFDYASEALGISAHDSRMLRRMKREQGDFLMKQNDEAVALQAHFNDHPDIKAVFEGDLKTLLAAGGKFAAAPKDAP